MKTIVSSIIALSLTVGLAGQAAAASHKKRHAHHYAKSYPAKVSGYRSVSPAGSSGYYEYLSDKLPFGSQQWWSVYEAQHGTGGRH